MDKLSYLLIIFDRPPDSAYSATYQQCNMWLLAKKWRNLPKSIVPLN